MDDNFDAGIIAGGDPNTGHTGVGLTPVNTDGTDEVDYLDLDSDNDGAEDAAERGTPGPTTAQMGVASDTDGDGLLDVFEGDDEEDGFDVNDENRDATSIALADTDVDLNADGTNAVPLNTDSDFRDNRNDDNDGDGVTDVVDIDDDNDGILDVDEAAARDVVQGQLEFFHNGDNTSDGSATYGTCLLYTSPSPRD